MPTKSLQGPSVMQGYPPAPELVQARKGFNLRYLESFGIKEYAPDVWQTLSIGWRMVLQGNDSEFLDLDLKNNQSALDHTKAVTNQIREFLDEGYLVKITQQQVLTLNPITMVVKPDATKPNGVKERLCIDVSRKLNDRIPLRSFEMVNIAPHFQAFKQGIWMGKIDLKNGYLHIKIVPDQVGHLSIKWQGQYYAFAYMPFGVNMAPYVFQRVMNEILYPIFRDKRVICESYLDDIWIQADTKHDCLWAIQVIVKHLETCGFTINRAKSVLAPTQRMEYLGIGFDSSVGQLYLTEEKVNKALKLIESIRSNPQIHGWQKLCGFLQFLTYACPEGKSHLRTLFANFAWKDSDPNSMTRPAIADLNWWVKSLKIGIVRPVLRRIDFLWRTDASETGCGLEGVTNGVRLSIEWDGTEVHSNVRELHAVFELLRRYGRDMEGSHVHVQMDNVASISTLNRGGSCSLALNEVRKRIWKLENRYRIHLSASFIPGIRNIVADALSRQKERDPVAEDDSLGECLCDESALLRLGGSKHVPIAVKIAQPIKPDVLVSLARRGVGPIPNAETQAGPIGKTSRGYDMEKSVTQTLGSTHTQTQGAKTVTQTLGSTRGSRKAADSCDISGQL